MFNYEIEEIFRNFTVSDVVIPVSYLQYGGGKETYIVYTPWNNDNSFSGDDTILGCVVYYDFDVYSKGNYYNIVAEMKDLLTENGWTWQPSKDSSDQYEKDTGMYHKTVCFAKPVQFDMRIPR